MIVRLTNRRLAWIDAVIADKPLLVAELNAERDTYMPEAPLAKSTVRASYLAWKLTCEAMINHTFNHRGHTKAKNGPVARGALQDVTRALNRYSTHAAFKRAAVRGHHVVSFPVWVTADGERHPAPEIGSNFGVLMPCWIGQGEMGYTYWQPETASVHAEDRLARQLTHEALLQHL